MKVGTAVIKSNIMFFVTTLYVFLLEIMLHIQVYRCLDLHIFSALFFSLGYVFFLMAILCFGKGVSGKIIWILCCGLYYIYYGMQIVYHQIFGNFLSIQSILKGTGQAMDFGHTILENVISTCVPLLLGGIALVGLIFVRICKIEIERSTKKSGLNFLVCLCIPVVGTLGLMCMSRDYNSAYQTKVQYHKTEGAMYRLGIFETVRKDLFEQLAQGVNCPQSKYYGLYEQIERAIFDNNDARTVLSDMDADKEESSDVGAENESSSEEIKEHEYGSHVLDIDFDQLMRQETDEEIKEMHAYFKGVTPTKENKYTGLFEGYNLIYITAESFSDVIINQERTPILYRMQQEGFQFENFYTPSWYLSTIDGEYVNCLSQIPVEGDWSLQHASENALPVALGNQLKNKGYACNAYHNHDAYYYDRTVTHPKLGYRFQAVGSGLTFESMYPESDLELMELTVKEYINQEPFHTYYMTMSGHLPYTYGYNSMAVKNRQGIESLGLSEEASCYLAANEELEYALEYLVTQLEQSGKLERTLFVIAPDHYPYGLGKGCYDELRGYEIEQDAFELYRNTCLIWSAAMPDCEQISFPVKVNKCGSNLDILPTVMNLMGLDYDSRLLAGRDLLSEEEGLVMFKDQSFLTADVRYNATTGETIWKNDQKADAYLEKYMQIVSDRFRYSALVLQKNYYSEVE